MTRQLAIQVKNLISNCQRHLSRPNVRHVALQELAQVISALRNAPFPDKALLVLPAALKDYPGDNEQQEENWTAVPPDVTVPAGTPVPESEPKSLDTNVFFALSVCSSRTPSPEPLPPIFPQPGTEFVVLRQTSEQSGKGKKGGKPGDQQATELLRNASKWKPANEEGNAGGFPPGSQEAAKSAEEAKELKRQKEEQAKELERKRQEEAKEKERQEELKQQEEKKRLDELKRQQEEEAKERKRQEDERAKERKRQEELKQQEEEQAKERKRQEELKQQEEEKAKERKRQEELKQQEKERKRQMELKQQQEEQERKRREEEAKEQKRAAEAKALEKKRAEEAAAAKRAEEAKAQERKLAEERAREKKLAEEKARELKKSEEARALALKQTEEKVAAERRAQELAAAEALKAQETSPAPSNGSLPSSIHNSRVVIRDRRIGADSLQEEDLKASSVRELPRKDSGAPLTISQSTRFPGLEENADGDVVFEDVRRKRAKKKKSKKLKPIIRRPEMPPLDINRPDDIAGAYGIPVKKKALPPLKK